MGGLLVLFLACAGADGLKDTDTASADSGAADTEDTSEIEDTDTVPLTARLTGAVFNSAGGPVVNARVNVCRRVCKTVYTDAAGAYAHVGIEAWTAMFYVVPDTETGLATPMVPLTLGDGEDRTLDVTMPSFDPPVPLPATAAEVEVSDGLFLTLGADTLEAAPLTDLGDEVRAVRVAADARPPVELAGEVLDVWYLAPWEATSERGVGVRARNDWTLPTGTQVRVRAASDPLEYTWLDAGLLTVSEDGTMLEGDAALPILTTVVLLRE